MAGSKYLAHLVLVLTRRRSTRQGGDGMEMDVLASTATRRDAPRGAEATRLD